MPRLCPPSGAAPRERAYSPLPRMPDDGCCCCTQSRVCLAAPRSAPPSSTRRRRLALPPPAVLAPCLPHAHGVLPPQRAAELSPSPPPGAAAAASTALTVPPSLVSPRRSAPPSSSRMPRAAPTASAASHPSHAHLPAPPQRTAEFKLSLLAAPGGAGGDLVKDTRHTFTSRETDWGAPPPRRRSRHAGGVLALEACGGGSAVWGWGCWRLAAGSAGCSAGSGAPDGKTRLPLLPPQASPGLCPSPGCASMPVPSLARSPTHVPPSRLHPVCALHRAARPGARPAGGRRRAHPGACLGPPGAPAAAPCWSRLCRCWAAWRPGCMAGGQQQAARGRLPAAPGCAHTAWLLCRPVLVQVQAEVKMQEDLAYDSRKETGGWAGAAGLACVAAAESCCCRFRLRWACHERGGPGARPVQGEEALGGMEPAGLGGCWPLLARGKPGAAG